MLRVQRFIAPDGGNKMLPLWDSIATCLQNNTSVADTVGGATETSYFKFRHRRLKGGFNECLGTAHCERINAI